MNALARTIFFLTVVFFVLPLSANEESPSAQKSVFAFRSIDVFISTSEEDKTTSGINDNFVGLHLNTGFEVFPGKSLQFDLAHMRSDGYGLDLIGIRPYWRNDTHLFGLSFEYLKLSVFESHIVALNYEKYDNDLLTVTTTVTYEKRRRDTDRWAAELHFVTYPRDHLLISWGMSFADDFRKQTDFDQVFRLEWLLPFNTRYPLALKAQFGGNYITRQSIAIKSYFSEFKSIRSIHRQSGYNSARFY